MAADRKKPSLVLLDTNALMMLFQFDIDIDSELARGSSGAYEIAVPSTVAKELTALIQNPALSAADRRIARMAQTFAARYPTIGADTQETTAGDTAILALAETCAADRRVVVVTNDRAFRQRLAAAGIVTGYMRAKKTLEFSGVF